MPTEREIKTPPTAIAKSPAAVPASTPPTIAERQAAARLNVLLQMLPAVLLEPPLLITAALHRFRDAANQAATDAGLKILVVTSMASTYGVTANAATNAALHAAKQNASAEDMISATGGTEHETFWLWHPLQNDYACAIRFATVRYPRPHSIGGTQPPPLIERKPDAMIERQIQSWRDFLVARERSSTPPPADSSRSAVPGQAGDPEKPAKRFAVAFSFSGERRDYVKQVDECLTKKLSPDLVFYDHRFKQDLARPNLDTYLQNIYSDCTELVVVFLCADYGKKEWCGLEWRAIRDMIKKKKDEEIMLFQFDGAPIKGLFSIDGSIPANGCLPREAAELIFGRLATNRSQQKGGL